MIRLLFAFALCLCTISCIEAQVVKRFHSNFEVEEINSIKVLADGDVTVNTWAGNTILIETLVVTNIGTNAVLNLLQKDGRYDLQLDKTADQATVTHKLKHRQSIKVKGVDMDETIKYTISIPDSFGTEDVEKMRMFTRNQ